jgi:aryl-alcohol dehydrogenase-like predicted oxidoreductase
MNFGFQTTEADAVAIMDKALESGINFIDTANVYGRQRRKGFSEQGGGRREKTIIATKVFNIMGNWPNQSRLSALHIRQACEASLRRLQTDHIDLYQMHHVYRLVTWEEVYQAMETLVQQGKVLYIGSSNFAGWHIAKAQDAAKERSFLGLVSEQSLYNLRDRMIELEVLPACKDYGMGVLTGSPLAGGWLGGVLQKGRDGRRADENLQKDILLVGAQPGSSRKVCALVIKLGEQEMMKLNEIWPGPGGEAPEAYAWQPRGIR